MTSKKQRNKKKFLHVFHLHINILLDLQIHDDGDNTTPATGFIVTASWMSNNSSLLYCIYISEWGVSLCSIFFILVLDRWYFLWPMQAKVSCACKFFRYRCKGKKNTCLWVIPSSKNCPVYVTFHIHGKSKRRDFVNYAST